MEKESKGQEMIFAEHPQATLPRGEPWSVLIVDDDLGVHDVTRLALDDVVFAGRPLEFLSATTGHQALDLLRARSGIALVLLDVVMESEHAGLRVVEATRQELGNRAVRFVLRTGQPGSAPERQIITDYDISDYKTKGELTRGKLYTTVLASLRTYQHIIELDRLRLRAEATAEALQRFFPSEFVELLGKEWITDLQLGDQIQREMTVMFVDIRGFTSRSEEMSPEECFAFINDLFAALCPLVREHRGIIDKFLGDGFLALFPGSADDALRAALALQRRVADRNAERSDALRLGVGIHTGSLMLGTVGDSERMEATVLSDAVNLAARLEALTKRYGTSVILSESALLATSDISAFGVRSIGEVTVPGKRSPTTMYELIDADPAELRAAKVETAEDFARGVALYRQGEHGEACMHLARVLKRSPEDAAARLYLRMAAEGLLASAEVG